jgi:hypothetical protein
VLEDAFGPAPEIRDRLRAAGSPDADVADEALEDLRERLFHLGSVHSATAYAVPFLAALARDAPHGRAELLWLLGTVADPTQAEGAALDSVREAVRSQLPILVPLLADKAPSVRGMAAYACAQAGVTAEPLLSRWRLEKVATVRASLALALGEVDPGGARERASARGADEVRLAAAMALLRTGQPLPDDVVKALVTAMGNGAEISGYWARDEDWFSELAIPPGAASSGRIPATETHEADNSSAQPTTAGEPRAGRGPGAGNQPPADDELHADDQPPAGGRRAGDGLLEMIVRTGSSEAIKLAVWTGSDRCEASRAAPARMVPLFAAALADPQVRTDAIQALAEAGAAAGLYADLFAEVVAGLPAAMVGDGVGVTEWAAAVALGRLGDPRWVDPVCTATAAGTSHSRLLPGPRRTPEALAAVRARLAADPSRPGVLPSVLGDWRAAEAVPELLAALPYAGISVSNALLDIGYDHPAIAQYLGPRIARRNPKAALAIRRITGDAEPLRDLIRRVLTGREQPQWRSLDVPGEAVRDLLPLAHERLTSDDAEIRMLAARVVASVEGRAAAVFATVRDVLAAGGVAAQAAAEMVTDRAWGDLEPLLREKLADRNCQIEAAGALVRLGVPASDMTEALVAGVDRGRTRAALAAIRGLRAVDTIPALEKLAAADRRLPMFHVHGRYVWDDEELNEDIHETITLLRC